MSQIKETIESLCQELLRHLGVSAEKVLIEKDGDLYTVHITLAEGEQPALLIGHHAETLNAFQRIISIMLYNRLQEKLEVLIDINNYRNEQKERIEAIAQGLAEKVQTDGRAALLRSFNPYERKLIHSYITEKFPDLQSISEGSPDQRVLRISKK
jgi:spoIIIJ-associated protein